LFVRLSAMFCVFYFLSSDSAYRHLGSKSFELVGFFSWNLAPGDFSLRASVFLHFGRGVVCSCAYRQCFMFFLSCTLTLPIGISDSNPLKSLDSSAGIFRLAIFLCVHLLSLTLDWVLFVRLLKSPIGIVMCVMCVALSIGLSACLIISILSTRWTPLHFSLSPMLYGFRHNLFKSTLAVLLKKNP